MPFLRLVLQNFTNYNSTRPLLPTSQTRGKKFDLFYSHVENHINCERETTGVMKFCVKLGKCTTQTYDLLKKIPFMEINVYHVLKFVSGFDQV